MFGPIKRLYNAYLLTSALNKYNRDPKDEAGLTNLQKVTSRVLEKGISSFRQVRLRQAVEILSKHEDPTSIKTRNLAKLYLDMKAPMATRCKALAYLTSENTITFHDVRTREGFELTTTGEERKYLTDMKKLVHEDPSFFDRLINQNPESVFLATGDLDIQERKDAQKALVEKYVFNDLRDTLFSDELRDKLKPETIEQLRAALIKKFPKRPDIKTASGSRLLDIYESNYKKPWQGGEKVEYETIELGDGTCWGLDAEGFELIEEKKKILKAFFSGDIRNFEQRLPLTAKNIDIYASLYLKASELNLVDIKNEILFNLKRVIFTSMKLNPSNVELLVRLLNDASLQHPDLIFLRREVEERLRAFTRDLGVYNSFPPDFTLNSIDQLAGSYYLARYLGKTNIANQILKKIAENKVLDKKLFTTAFTIYKHAQSPVTVQASQSGEQASPQIPDELVEHLFDAFITGDVGTDYGVLVRDFDEFLKSERSLQYLEGKSVGELKGMVDRLISQSELANILMVRLSSSSNPHLVQKLPDLMQYFLTKTLGHSEYYSLCVPEYYLNLQTENKETNQIIADSMVEYREKVFKKISEDSATLEQFVTQLILIENLNNIPIVA